MIEAKPVGNTSSVSVEITPGGYNVAGKEEVLLCASLFYFRIPREQWRARLKKIRSSGYRVIDVYIPWNFHEVAPGEWDFEGRKNVAEFLDLAHEAGLLVLARPGPYICSEWDGGALPAWLTLDPELVLRSNNAPFLKQVQGWFDVIMPILAAREVGRGGPVISVQLENELDFFDSEGRHEYVSALRDMALAHGIAVPLVACAGQGDLAGASGDVAGVIPTCNFYPDDSSADFELEVRDYQDLLASRGLPLLVTETNRLHVTLRRMLVSGVKFLAPYLQASGYNFGFTPSVGNWGSPAGLMTHNYDFGGFLSPTGKEREEIVEARVLSRVTGLLGEHMSRGLAVPADLPFDASFPTALSPSKLLLDGGGTITGVPNLGEMRGVVTFKEETRESVTVGPRRCLYVYENLPLDHLGGRGELHFATADLVDIKNDSLTFSSPVGCVISAKDGSGEIAGEWLEAPAPGQPTRATLKTSHQEWQVTVLAPEDVSARPLGIPVEESDIAEQERPPEAPLAIEEITLLQRDPLGDVVRSAAPQTSEAIGVYRGRAHYSADVEACSKLLIEGAGDIVDVELDGETVSTVVPYGAVVPVETKGASLIGITAETWGHSNFDDKRLPNMQLGSRRGISQVWCAVEQRDVTALWRVSGGEQWAGDPAPLRSLGGWSSTRVGAPATYQRTLPCGNTEVTGLQFRGVSGSIAVAVNGEEHLVTEDDPWLIIPAAGSCDISVTVIHQPGMSLKLTAYDLVPIEGWTIMPEKDETLIARVREAKPAGVASLPLHLRPGQEVALEVQVPEGEQELTFEGASVRVSAFTGSELLGRTWVEDRNRPVFTGGDPDRLWLPAQWNSGSVRLLVRGTLSEEAPILTRVVSRPVGM